MPYKPKRVVATLHEEAGGMIMPKVPVNYHVTEYKYTTVITR